MGIGITKKERTRIEAFYNKEKSTIKEPKISGKENERRKRGKFR